MPAEGAGAGRETGNRSPKDRCDVVAGFRRGRHAAAAVGENSSPSVSLSLLSGGFCGNQIGANGGGNQQNATMEAGKRRIGELSQVIAAL